MGHGIAVAMLALGLSGVGHAQTTVTWTSGSDGSWSSGGNWDTGVPADSLTTNYAYFNGTGVTVTVPNSNTSIAGLEFGSSAGAYTISKTGGAQRSLTVGAYGIRTYSSSGQLITGGRLTLALGADTSFLVEGSGGLTISPTGSNEVDLSTYTLTLGGSGSGLGTINSVISGSGGVTKTGSGTWLLSAVNTYTGATNIGTAGGANGGTLQLGAASTLPGTTVNLYGGTLDINSRNNTIGALNLGGGAGGTTASITSTSGSLTLGGNITYSATNNPGGASIAADFALGGVDRTITVGNSSGAATDLTLGKGDYSSTITMGSNTLTIDGAGDTLINAFVGASGDSGGFTKNGTGTTTFYGDYNNYTGLTTVNDGTLVLDTSNSYSDLTIRGNLVIGDGTGAADSATVRYGSGSANNKIADTSQVTINSDGVLNLNSKNDTIGSFTLSGGHITTGTGILTLNGNITTTANAAGRTALIDGVLSLGNATRTFTVADDTPVSDLTISATINFGSIIKAGAGTMTLTGNNTLGYGGTTTVSAGVLNIQNSNALGQTGVSDPTKGTSVSSGAALQVQGGIAVGTEALSLTGTGVSSDGALRNISGNNSWAGAISLGTGGARINSDAGTLTIGGTITATNQNLLVGGSGNTTVTGAIGTGTGTITKDGSGTLTLSGNSTYSGTTTVNAGVVNIQHASALGSTGAGTTVSASGAALQVQGGIAVGSEALSLTGTGISNTGALRNISGNNSLTGTVTVGAGGARINSDAGTLTLSGGVTLGANTLTTGGSGNITQSGVIAGTGGLTKDGSGTLLLSGNNSYTGATTISAGTLRLNANERIANTSSVTVASGATFDVNGKTETIGSLAGAGSVLIGSGQVTAGGNNTSTTFSGTLTGSGSFTKTGTGLMQVASDLGFGGTLNMAGGTLEFDAANAFTGAVNISAGTLRLADVTLTLATLNITGNSTIDFAGAASILSVTNLNISAGVTLTITNWQDATDFFYAQNWAGAVVDTTGATPMNQVVFSGYTGNNTKWLSYDQQVTPVPEPAAYGAMLMAAGLAWFGLRRRNRAARK